MGQRQRFCDGISRRNFLKIGAFGAGLTLADMLRLRAAAAGTGSATGARRNKAAIMIYLPGGPSHMDMYDLKPDAPIEFRGEFKPIATNVPGVQICEHFPLQASMWDKLAVRPLARLRRRALRLAGHDRLQRAQQPHRAPPVVRLGDVEAARRQHSDIPPFVSLRGMSLGTEPGFLGVAHRPFTPSGPGCREPAPGQRRRHATASTTARRCWPASTTSAATSTPAAR